MNGFRFPDYTLLDQRVAKRYPFPMGKPVGLGGKAEREEEQRTVGAFVLQRSGAATSMADIVAAVDTDAGRARVRTYLQSRPFPHFEACHEETGMLVKVEEDGTRTRGRFVNRVFVEKRQGVAQGGT